MANTTQITVGTELNIQKGADYDAATGLPYGTVVMVREYERPAQKMDKGLWSAAGTDALLTLGEITAYGVYPLTVVYLP